MKKSTGILFVVAVVLAALAYFYEWKRPAPKDDAANGGGGARPTFNVRQEDINQITVTRAGMTMVFDLKSDGWHISQPISAPADQAALGDMANLISEVPLDRTLTNVSAADLQTYGLVNPQITVEFKTQNGMSHKLVIGGKDFSNLEIYGYVDDSKDVSLISNVIVTTVDKPLEAFRDHAVFTVNPDNVTGFELDNASGMLVAQRNGADWKFVKPLPTPGSTANIADLFGNLGMALIAGFIDDSPNNFAKYGLDHPAIRFRVTLSDGSTRELLIGKKEGAGYDAESSYAGALFRVPEAVTTLLGQSLMDLRAKALYAGQDDSVARVELHNEHGVTTCARDSSGSMNIEQTAAQKTPTMCPDFMGPLERASSAKIYDSAPAAIAAKLAKPTVEVIVTDTGGKKTDIQISDPAGNPIYGRSDAGPSLYEFDKGSFDNLSYNPSAAK